MIYIVQNKKVLNVVKGINYIDGELDNKKKIDFSQINKKPIIPSSSSGIINCNYFLVISNSKYISIFLKNYKKFNNEIKYFILLY